jgi:[ribosomal protein S5]-alanine N-acetyltransferase
MDALATERLVVRRLTVGDADAVERVLGEPREEWLGWTVASYDRLAELHQPPYGERAVERRSDGRVVGLVGLVPSLAPFDWSAFHRPEVGLYWATEPAERGRGYAGEAAAALIAYGFDHLHLARVIAMTDHENLASIGVMRKLGMHIVRNPNPEPPWLQVVGSLDAPRKGE